MVERHSHLAIETTHLAPYFGEAKRAGLGNVVYCFSPMIGVLL